MSLQVKNLIIADKLQLIANLMTLDGASIWSVRAYTKAAELLSGLDVPAHKVSDFQKFDGIGSSTASAISEIMATGSCSVLNSLRNRYPDAENAFSLTCVSGVGVKKAISLYASGITNIEQLSKACDDGLITNKSIVRGVKMALNSRGRLPINEVLPIVTPLLQQLRDSAHVIRAEFAGSVRRGRDTIKDVDVIVATSDRVATAALFNTFGDPLIEGNEKARVMVPVDGSTVVQFDLLFAEPSSFGAALAYFTGSKEHNVSLRKRALTMGYTINEHGFWTTSGARMGGTNEEELYDLLKLPWCPPELREGTELRSKIPVLVTREDIYGDWHMHSNWSADARDTIEDMAIAAKNRGLKVIGLTDHTEINYGWKPEEIELRTEECNTVSDKVGIKIHSACETGVNKDGSLDWPDEYLNKMDYVIASIHKSHSFDPVHRLITAARHPKVKVIGHPTGLALGRRDIPEDEWRDLFKVCAQEGVLLEVNGARLDLPVHLIKMAKEEGCKFVLNGDAHSVHQLHWQDYAITLARRAGLTKNDLGKPSWDVV